MSAQPTRFPPLHRYAVILRTATHISLFAFTLFLLSHPFFSAARTSSLKCKSNSVISWQNHSSCLPWHLEHNSNSAPPAPHFGRVSDVETKAHSSSSYTCLSLWSHSGSHSSSHFSSHRATTTPPEAAPHPTVTYSGGFGKGLALQLMCFVCLLSRHCHKVRREGFLPISLVVIGATIVCV